MKNAIMIGASRDTVRECRKSILAILRSKRGDTVIVAALDALTKMSSVNNTTISNCTIGEMK